jgi:hypothetical protein
MQPGSYLDVLADKDVTGGNKVMINRTAWISFLTVTVLPLLAFAQENGVTVFKGPYLGQKPPGLVPEIFARGVVSTGGFEHSKIEFAKDGSALYWAAQPEGNSAGSLGKRYGL